MGRALKIVGWILGILIVLLIVAGVALTLFFDPNQYRGQIASQVEKVTGRELTIAGDIDLSLFPWIGVEISDVTLGNAEGFGPEPFARVGEAQVRVALLPLLRREVQVDTVVLDGLRLNLARRKAGDTNWDDLTGAAATEQPPAEPTAPAEPPAGQEPRGPAIAALAVNGLQVRDARISWQDAMTDTQATLSNLSLTSGALAFGVPFPVALEFDVEANQPEIAGHIALEAQVLAEPENQHFTVDDLVLTTEMRSPLLPAGELAARLTAAAEAQLKAGTADLKQFELTALGTRISGQVQAAELNTGPTLTGNLAVTVDEPAALLAGAGIAEAGIEPAALEGAALNAEFTADLGQGTAQLQPLAASAAGVELSARATASELLTAPKVRGHLASKPFVPRDVLQALGIALPEGIDPAALTKASLATDFTAGTDQVAISELTAQVDDSTLTGSASVARFEAPVIRYELRLDGIDLDSYLPAPPEQEGEPQPAPTVPPTPAEAAAAAAAQLPLDLLRKLDVAGTVDIGTLKVANLRSSDIHATLKGQNGLFRVAPSRAKLYQGSYAGKLTFDVREATPQLAIDEELTGVQAGPLLEDMLGKAYVTGSASVSAKLSGQGLEPQQLTRTLNGTGRFEFRDGAVAGINIAEAIRKAMAATQGQPAPDEEPQQTDFAIIQGTFTAKDGVVRNQDLSAKTPLMRIQGEGSIDLVKERLDYLVQAAIVGTLKGQGGQELQQLRNITIPVRIKGPFEEPKIDVELGKALEARAQQELEKEKQKLQQQLEQRKAEEQRKLEQRAEEEKRRLQEQLDKEKKNLEQQLQQKLRESLGL